MKPPLWSTKGSAWRCHQVYARDPESGHIGLESLAQVADSSVDEKAPQRIANIYFRPVLSWKSNPFAGEQKENRRCITELNNDGIILERG